ncbi:MAG: glycosyltransferase family 4 protein [Candidatus Omnitrophica bacterium]|nr:glycosyltransferase family 4 protein [Candidatus Omnitrophota bacterium]
MKILFVSSEFPLNKNEATGGIGTYLLNITEGLTNLGHEVIVLTTRKEKKADYRNIRLIYVNWGEKFIKTARKILSFSFFQRFLNFLEYPLFFNFGSFLKIEKIVKKEKIDIIEGNDFGGELFFYLLLRRKGPPVVLVLHTPSFVIQKYNNEPNNLFYRIMKFLEVFCLKKADSLYSPSKSLAKIISKEIKRPVKTIIPHPFKPLYNFSNIKRKNNLILYVGKLQAKKGVFLLIEAIPRILKKFPKTLFYFAGPDTLQNGVSVKSLMIKRIKELGIFKSVIFLGNLPKKDLYKLYRLATAIVIPSLWENLGFVCFEAMSQGVSVIASKVGGFKEIFKNKETGLLFCPVNQNELAKSVISLLRNPNLRRKISHQAMTLVKQKYDQKSLIKKKFNYFNRLIKK